MPPMHSITFTGTGSAVEPLSICRDMWNIYLPTDGAHLFTKKDITIVDTLIDVSLYEGLMLYVTSEGIIPGTTSCVATSFQIAGRSGPYRIVIPVLNINSSSNENGTGGGIIASIRISPTLDIKYNYAGTF